MRERILVETDRWSLYIVDWKDRDYRVEFFKDKIYKGCGMLNLASGVTHYWPNDLPFGCNEIAMKCIMLFDMGFLDLWDTWKYQKDYADTCLESLTA